MLEPSSDSFDQTSESKSPSVLCACLCVGLFIGSLMVHGHPGHIGSTLRVDALSCPG